MPKSTPERTIDAPHATASSAGGKVTPGAGRVPQAGPGGVIAVGWLPNCHGHGINADLLDGLHGADYALVEHLHDDRYSLLGHHHDDRYSLLGHHHDDRYSLLGHTHDDRYSLLGHHHDDRYSLLGHTHPPTPAVLALDDLTDVEAPAPPLRGVLTWSGAAWEPLVPAEIEPDVATDVIWDAKGDLAVGTGANAAARLAAGSNGQVLTADSTQATGLKWAAPAPAAPTLSLPTAQQAIPANESRYYYLCHWYNNLHVRFNEASSSSSLRLYLNGALIYTSPGSGGAHTINLDLTTYSLTAGAIYLLRLRASDAATTDLYFLAESSSAL